MASRLSFLKMAQSRSTALKCASTSTRRQSSTLAVNVSPFPELNFTRRYSSDCVMGRIHDPADLPMYVMSLSFERTGSPSVVPLLSYFAGPQNREIPHTGICCTGFFVDPTLIVTSARAVGLVSTVYDSERGADIHNCFIARTIAHIMKDKVLRTSPVALNFERDIAVLKIDPEEMEGHPLPPPCAVAQSSADKDEPTVGVVRYPNCSVYTITLAGYREGLPRRPKAPWPLVDTHGWSHSGAWERRECNVVSVNDFSGSPWFNSHYEVIGMASWAAEAENGRVYSYMMPASCITFMMNYAKTKGPNDPIIMDRWINGHIFPDNNSDIVKESVRLFWTNKCIYAKWDAERCTVNAFI